MMLLMWLAGFPPATVTADGSPAGSGNPLLDYHVVHAIVLVVLALTHTGHPWGLGRRWAGLPLVQRNRWALRPTEQDGAARIGAVTRLSSR